METNLEDDYLENEEIYVDFDFTNSQESDDSSYDEDSEEESVNNTTSIEPSLHHHESSLKSKKLTLEKLIATSPKSSLTTLPLVIKSPSPSPSPSPTIPSTTQSTTTNPHIKSGNNVPELQSSQPVNSVKVTGPSFASALSAANSQSSTSSSIGGGSSNNYASLTTGASVKQSRNIIDQIKCNHIIFHRNRY